MKLSAAVSMGLFLLPEMATAAGGFYNSCKSNWRIERGYFMVAECRRNNGSYRKTSQDLNLCVANRNSKLASANNGRFGNSCYSCQQGQGIITAVEPATSYMSCLCDNSKSTDIDLNSFVSNNDGYLWCHGHRSAPI